MEILAISQEVLLPMTTLESALNAIAEYERRLRRAEFNQLEISGLYDLFPAAGSTAAGVAARWPNDNWPHAERAGVYLIFDLDLRLLYVGKASLKSTLGGRLYNYFRLEKDGTCRVRHANWSTRPRYVMTVAVPEEMRWEAPALEEYLIGALTPSDNTVGIYPSD